MCELAMNTRTNIVGFGTVVEGELEGDEPQQEGCLMVSVVGFNKGDEPLPFPVENAKLLLVRDAVGNHVSWPENLVIRKRPVKTKKKASVAKKLFNTNDLPIRVPKCCQLLYKHAKVTMNKTGLAIMTKLDDEVFGYDKDLVILTENVLNLLEMCWIGSGVIEAYMA